MSDVSLVFCYDSHNRLLLGLRRDCNKWTLPGGHLDDGEPPRDGAIRELKEETGLTADSLTEFEVVESDCIIHTFTARCFGEPTIAFDPDEECSRWEWIDVSKGIPQNIWDQLYGPEDDSKNIVKRVFRPSPGIRTESGIQAIKKANPLLFHPNPIERGLALKASPTIQDIEQAALDPDKTVWLKALEHTNALRSICANTRDSTGKLALDKWDLALLDPRIDTECLDSMATAIRTEPEDLQAIWLRKIQQHPRCRLSLAKSLDFLSELAPSHDEALELYSSSDRAPLSDINREENRHRDLVQKWERGYYNFEDGVWKSEDSRLLVRPFFLDCDPLLGWSEITYQDIFMKLGLPHLHTFFSYIGDDPYLTQILGQEVIPGTYLWKVSPKIDLSVYATIDFVCGKTRKMEEILLIPEPVLIHNSAFRYQSGTSIYEDLGVGINRALIPEILDVIKPRLSYLEDNTRKFVLENLLERLK